MGRAATAVSAVVPEARVASAVTGRRRPAARDPRATAPGSAAARQREQIEAIKAQRPAEQAPAAEDPAPPSSGAGPSLPSLPAPAGAAAATGSGFLLGVFTWAIALAYLRGGPDGVRKFLTAKFLNKV